MLCFPPGRCNVIKSVSVWVVKIRPFAIGNLLIGIKNWGAGFQLWLKRCLAGAEEVAQQQEEYTALPEDPDSIPMPLYQEADDCR